MGCTESATAVAPTIRVYVIHVRRSEDGHSYRFTVSRSPGAAIWTFKLPILGRDWRVACEDAMQRVRNNFGQSIAVRCEVDGGVLGLTGLVEDTPYP